MPTSLDRNAEPLVRPRYLDADLTDPLPLWDRFSEACLESSPAPVLVVNGRRGSGVTTALRYLAGQCRELDRAAVWAPSWEELTHDPAPGTVLICDLSVTPFDLERDAWPGSLPDAWRGLPTVIGVTHLRPLLLKHLLGVLGCDRTLMGPLGVERALDREPREVISVELAPWNHDDLIELLGADVYREERSAVLARLRELPSLGPSLALAWSARVLVDAVYKLGPDEPPTPARVYANVLDGFAATTVDVLRHLEGSTLTRADLARFPLELEVPAAEELSWVLETSREVLEHMVREDAPTPHDYEGVLGKLVLPGLADFVQAGECVRWLEQGQEPPPLRRGWVPFFADLARPRLLERLDGYLKDPDPPVRADGAVATILHACGRPVPFGPRSLLVQGAILENLMAADVDLAGSRFENANLDNADLSKSDLRGTRWTACNLGRLVAGGARLDGSWWRDCALSHAFLVQHRSVGVRFEGCDLSRSEWGGGDLKDVRFEDCDLRHAEFHHMALKDFVVTRGHLGGACFAAARFDGARFTSLDLRETEFDGAELERSEFTNCRLSGMRFAASTARDGIFGICELSEADFSGLQLDGARFNRCLAHGADFSGCSLRKAVFNAVRFETGSTREGMLQGGPASEGTRTGYYAEGTTDEAWSTQPDLPLASFRGADLTGATIEGSLFRLDFRGATLDPELRARAKHEGALLDP